MLDYPDIRDTIEHGALIQETDEFDCEFGPGAAHRGLFGPFGLLVLADDNLTEQTALFFFISYSRDSGTWTTKFCADQSRYDHHYHLVCAGIN